MRTLSALLVTLFSISAFAVTTDQMEAERALSRAGLLDTEVTCQEFAKNKVARTFKGSISVERIANLGNRYTIAALVFRIDDGEYLLATDTRAELVQDGSASFYAYNDKGEMNYRKIAYTCKR